MLCVIEYSTWSQVQFLVGLHWPVFTHHRDEKLSSCWNSSGVLWLWILHLTVMGCIVLTIQSSKADRAIRSALILQGMLRKGDGMLDTESLCMSGTGSWLAGFGLYRDYVLYFSHVLHITVSLLNPLFLSIGSSNCPNFFIPWCHISESIFRLLLKLINSCVWPK